MDLIPVTYDNNQITVLGRDLHAALEIKTEYRHWFPRMCEYGFEEGVDYIKYDEQKQAVDKDRPENTVHNPNPKLNHQLTLDMAKEIAMIQRSPTGRKVRKYFIEVEKQYRNRLQDNQLSYYEVQATVAKAIIAAGQIAGVLKSSFDVNQDIARVHAVTLVEKEYDVDLSDVKKLLPATSEPEIDDLTPTKIAEIITQQTSTKHTARQINTWLHELGFQQKSGGNWVLTETGKQYGSMYPYERNGHTGYQLRWKSNVIPVLQRNYANTP